MDQKKRKANRIVALDMHPDIYSAACLKGGNPATATFQWTHDDLPTQDLEQCAQKHLRKEDTVVLEASGNSFAVASWLHDIGYAAIVLESCQAAKIKHGFCDDDKASAQKLARVYLTGLAKIVWQPTPKTKELRELFFAYRNAVKDCTRSRNRIRAFLNESCVRLPKGTRLAESSGEQKALAARDWTPTQRLLIAQRFESLRHHQAQRKLYEKTMAVEISNSPKWASLFRLMGIRHRVAFVLMAIVGDIERFPTHKKLVAYLGLSPRKRQSGNDKKGVQLGIGKGGRGDARAMLLQSAHNALAQKSSPFTNGAGNCCSPKTGT